MKLAGATHYLGQHYKSLCSKLIMTRNTNVFSENVKYSDSFRHYNHQGKSAIVCKDSTVAIRHHKRSKPSGPDFDPVFQHLLEAHIRPFHVLRRFRQRGIIEEA